MPHSRIALLLVDDHPENLVALKAVLGDQEELELVMVGSGNDALRQTLRRDFALVLLDVQMPGMDGFETAELMRTNPKTRHLPIIFVTAGMNDTQLQFKGYDLGAVDYLIKPFDPHILKSKVRVFCELYQQRRELEAHRSRLEVKVHDRAVQLKNSEERFSQLVTHASVGIYEVDVNGCCQFVNPGWCADAGLSAEEAAGEGWTRTLHPEDRDSLVAAWQAARDSGKPWSGDFRFLRPDGSVTWISGSTTPLRTVRGDIVGYLGNNLNITERKRNEAWERTRAAVMDELTHGTPLHAILQQIANSAAQQVTGMRCAILLVDEFGDKLIRCAAPYLKQGDSPMVRLIHADHLGCTSVARDGRSACIGNIHAHPECTDCWPKNEPVPPNGVVSCWSEPLNAIDGQVLGVFVCYRYQPGDAAVGDLMLIRKAVRLAALVVERRRTENALQIAASVHQAIGEAITVTDADNRIIAINPAFTLLTGYTAEEAIGQTPSLLKSGQHDAKFYRDMWLVLETTGRWQGEICNRRKNGEEYPEWLSINTIYDSDGKVLRRIAMFSDITDKKRAEETIWRQANYDPLTELPNRRLFRDRLEQEVRKAVRSGLQVAVLFIDLDRFKEVNDTLGHHTGDRLLIDAARRISDCVRATDTVARLGGDEFTIILSDLTNNNPVDKVAQSLLQTLTAPFSINGETVYVSASIGITIFPNDAADVDTLLKNADQAMYASKGAGRSRFSYFTASMQTFAQERLQLANDLRGALAAGQFELHLQPIVELASGRIAKAEALLRWTHPQQGQVSPAQFIPIAEETGMIDEIGDWVFRESAHMAKAWNQIANGNGPIQISVNKSPRQFFVGNTHETWIAHLAEIGLPPACLVIEITEGLLLDDRPDIAEKLACFRAAGIGISLDDFGTGYSAMAYLKKFPIDFLKIDRSFVRDMAIDPNDAAIVNAIIVMAHKLGLKVVAEGVETIEQRDLLIEACCDYGQGYLFARPMAAQQMLQSFAHSLPPDPARDYDATTPTVT